MVHVAVVARPGAPALEACLAALRAAGVAAPAVHAIGADGPAVARNAALAACEQDVIAYVEDDVAVEPGWLDALERAWAAADERVAVIGGPLAGPDGTARVDGPAPTYPGGNASFRASALRGAGGFWPARGHPDQRDWFGAEHEVQRELARAGWRLEFAAGAAARRVGAAPSLAQRARTGAREQAIGEPQLRGAALRTALRALAGAALGRRRERAGRAAQAAGALLGRRLVRRELEPVAAETPFRASVPMPPRRRRRRARDAGPAILLYHRIADVDDDPLGLAVSPARWAEQLDVLRAGAVVPLEAIAAGDAPPGAVAVTFDDGYADNAVLREAGLPITVFATTGHVAEQRPFWWDAVTRACRERAGERVEVEDRAFVLGPAALPHLHGWLQALSPERIDAVLAALHAPTGPRPLTVDELRELAAHVAIGAHTRRHRALRRATPDEQRAEIEGSRDDLERWLGTRPIAFAYPYGVPGSAFDATSVALVRAAGFACAVQNGPGGEGGRFALPRRAVPDVGGEEFARWLRQGVH